MQVKVGGMAFGSKTSSTSAAAIVSAATHVPNGVYLKADPANTTRLAVGKSDVTYAAGYPLAAGEEIFLQIDNLADLYVIAESGTPTLRYAVT